MNKNTKLALCITGIITGILIIAITLICSFNHNSLELNNMDNTISYNDTINTIDLKNNKTKEDNSETPSNKVKENDGGMQSNNAEEERRMPNGMQDNKMMQMPSNINNGLNNIEIFLIIIGSILLTVSWTYLLMSSFASNKVFINTDKILIYVMLNIILATIVSFGTIKVTNNILTERNTIQNVVK